MIPPVVGLFLIGFGGYWENEAGNEQIVHVNPNLVTYVVPHKYGPNGNTTHYAMHIQGSPFPLIVHESELQITGENKEAGFAVN